jgi:hypothetical protein
MSCLAIGLVCLLAAAGGPGSLVAPRTHASLLNTSFARTAATPVPIAETADQHPIFASYRVQEYSRFDRIVFVFRGGHPPWRARYVGHVTMDGSGAPLSLEGHAFLLLTFIGVDATGRNAHERPLAPHDALLRQVKPAGDFEGYLSFGLGLSHRTAYRFSVLRDPDRVLLDLTR